MLQTTPIKLYLDNGYINFKAIRETKYPFIFIGGPRGTGKTYGALKDLNENGLQYILMRRTNKVIDILKDPTLSPFNKLNNDHPEIACDIEATQIGGTIKRSKDGSTQGMLMPLSTFSNVRGFSYDECEVMLYDEVIPETGDRPIKNEGDKLDNAYETVNRNRELPPENRNPLQLICMGNLDNIVAPVIISWGISRHIYDMQKKSIEQKFLPELGIAIFLILQSPISEKKSNTALYRRNAGSKQAEVAIKNNWVFDDTLIERRSLGGYQFLMGFGAINIYKKKNKSDYYVTERKDIVTIHERDTQILRREYRSLIDAYYDGDIHFSDPLNLALFLKYFNLKM